MERRVYLANADGWVAGRRVRKDEELRLTPAEAAYEPVRPKPEPARRARRSRKEAAE